MDSVKLCCSVGRAPLSPPHGRYPHKCTKEHTGKKDTGARNVEEVDVGDTWVAHMGCIVAGARRRYPLWVSSGCSSRPIDSARRGQSKSSPAARPPVSMTSCARATYESPPLVGRTAKGPTIASQAAGGTPRATILKSSGWRGKAFKDVLRDAPPADQEPWRRETDTP
ncbi:hypothetical protein BD626DRAFT_178126 [Schizophyllum amplum]|uniref:Uncharacterized protein n=1 Tax=Schizophyllum amplum TaxID=97359 RepID=A0A550C2D1_9AGAR|nr:hypothetical protein BD626DRAFT_178126 [Auriculariopsis ampla]